MDLGFGAACWLVLVVFLFDCLVWSVVAIMLVGGLFVV